MPRYLEPELVRYVHKVNWDGVDEVLITRGMFEKVTLDGKSVLPRIDELSDDIETGLHDVLYETIVQTGVDKAFIYQIFDHVSLRTFKSVIHAPSVAFEVRDVIQPFVDQYKKLVKYSNDSKKKTPMSEERVGSWVKDGEFEYFCHETRKRKLSAEEDDKPATGDESKTVPPSGGDEKKKKKKKYYSR
jgi:hypothetical protein